jgi:hypothetical protein
VTKSEERVRTSSNKPDTWRVDRKSVHSTVKDEPVSPPRSDDCCCSTVLKVAVLCVDHRDETVEDDPLFS